MSSPVWKQRRGAEPLRPIRATWVKWRGKPCGCNRDGAPDNCRRWAKERRDAFRAAGRFIAEKRAQAKRNRRPA